MNFNKIVIKNSCILVIVLFLSFSCNEVTEGLRFSNNNTVDFFAEKKTISNIEKKFIRNSLIDIQTLSSGIKVSLAYASENNFTGINLYGSLNKCYLPGSVAMKLAAAQDSLQAIFPGFSLLVLDATRPQSIQQMMWDSCKVHVAVRAKYLARPVYKSMHNYGAAIDLTIVDDSGKELDMGTPFDFFDELAEPRLEFVFLNQGKLSLKQVENRKLLRKVMTCAGFIPISNEWWHFEAGSRRWATENLKLIE